MKKFATRVILFVVLFLLYDKAFLFFAYQSAANAYDDRLGEIVSGQLNKDVIILGASRGSRGVLAKNIETETGLSTKNLCYHGADIIFQEFIFKNLISFNSPPKLLLLVIDDSLEFKPNDRLKFRNDVLYSFVKYPVIWKELAYREKRSIILSRVSVLYRLNLNNLDLRKETSSDELTLLDCGSTPISRQRKDREWNFNFADSTYSIIDEEKEKLDAFKRILSICQKNDIAVVITFPPVYKIHNSQFEERIRHIGGDRCNYFLYDQKNPLYESEKCFYDQDHLNLEGANEFTNELINYIKNSHIVISGSK